jgi:hypothetical protein
MNESMHINIRDIPLTQPELGQYLKARRLEAGLKMHHLVAATGWSPSCICKMERNSTRNHASLRGNSIRQFLESCGYQLIQDDAIDLTHDLDKLYSILGREYKFCSHGLTTDKQRYMSRFFNRKSGAHWTTFHHGILDLLNLGADIPEQIGPWMKQQRLDRNLPVTWFWKQSFVKQTLYKLEQGSSVPKLPSVLKWLSIMNIPLIVRRKNIEQDNNHAD